MHERSQKYVDAILQMLENKGATDDELERTSAMAEDGELIAEAVYDSPDVRELLRAPLSSLNEVGTFHPDHDSEQLRKYAGEIENFVSSNRRQWLDILSVSPSAESDSEKNHFLQDLQTASQRLGELEGSKTLKYVSVIGKRNREHNQQIINLKNRQRTKDDEIEILTGRVDKLEATTWQDIDEVEKMVCKHEFNQAIRTITADLTEEMLDRWISRSREQADEDAKRFQYELREALEPVEDLGKVVKALQD